MALTKFGIMCKDALWLKVQLVDVNTFFGTIHTQISATLFSTSLLS